MTRLLIAISNSTAESILVKATFVLAVGLLLTLMLRHNRASVRHMVLTATFVVLLALPLVALLMPNLPIITATPEPPPNLIWIGSVALVAPVPFDPKVAFVGEVVRLIWGIGAALCLVPMTVGSWRIHKLRRSAVRWQGSHELPPHTELLAHRDLTGPMACGVFSPAILLPQEAETWSEEDVHRALLHEAEHIKRGDLLSQHMARFVCAIYWFHPLAWLARRRLMLEAELSCDDAVVAQSEPTAYADQLVRLAELSHGRSQVLAMADRSDLRRRVRSVLDARQARGRAGTLLEVLTCAIAVILVSAVGPLKIEAAPPNLPAVPPMLIIPRPNPAVQPPFVGPIPLATRRPAPSIPAPRLRYPLGDYGPLIPNYLRQAFPERFR